MKPQSLAKFFNLRTIRLLLLSALVLGVVVNLTEFMTIDNNNITRYKALHKFESPDLIATALHDSGNIRGYYAAWYTLAKTAPDSTILIPRESILNNYTTISQIYGYGDVKDVRIVDIDPTVSEKVDPTKYVVASGENAKQAPYFAIATPSNNKIISYSTRRPVELRVPITPVGFHLTFLLTAWNGPKTPLAPETDDVVLPHDYILLLDTALLPQPIRGELPQ